MKNKRIIDAWNQVEISSGEDSKILHAILARKNELEKKQERRDNALLCFIQILLFVMALSMIAIVLVISPKIIGALLLGIAVCSGLLSVIIILLHAKKQQERGQWQ